MHVFHRHRPACAVLCVFAVLLLSATPSAHGACLDTLGSYDRGYAYSVDVVGNLAYVGSGTSLLVVDVTDGSQPLVVGEIVLPSIVYDIAVVDGIAYIAAEDLIVVDVSDPTSLQVEATQSFDDAARALAVDDGFLYLLLDAFNSNDDQIRIFDLASPLAPQEVASIGPIPLANEGRIVIEGDLAFFPRGSRLVIYDVSDPTAPVLLSETPASISQSFRQVGDLLYASGSNSLSIFNIADPAQPTLLGEVTVNSQLTDLQVVSLVALVSTRRGQLLVIDVSDPTLPELVRIVPGVGRTSRSALNGDTLYIAQQGGGLNLFDVSAAQNPQDLGRLATLGSITRIERRDDLLFLAASDGGLHVLDITDISQPAPFSTFVTDGEVNDFHLDGDTAFIANGSGGVVALDISDPSAIQELDRLVDGDEVNSVDGEGGFVFVSDRFFGVRVVDAANPAALQEVGTFEAVDRAESLLVEDDVLYLADAVEGIKVLDVSTPASPVLIGSRDTLGRALRFSKEGPRLFVDTDDNKTINNQLFDVSDPTEPQLLDNYLCSGNTIDLEGDAGYLTCEGEVRLIRINASQTIQDVTARTTNDRFSGIQRIGDQLFLGSERLGLKIFDLDGCDGLLTDGFESGDVAAWSNAVP